MQNTTVSYSVHAKLRVVYTNFYFIVNVPACMKFAFVVHPGGGVTVRE